MGSQAESLTPLKGTKLFSSFKLGKYDLCHRIAQAPCTRMRGVKESDGIYVPGDLMVKYYSQRASKGGLQITEATDISHYASGYPGVPGIFSASQIAGWQRVTDSVHKKGGIIFLQIWHTGRASPSSCRDGMAPPSASNVPMDGKWLDGTQCSEHPPVPMTAEEIHATTKDFVEAAKRAVEAGFDGVEIHGANGYLLEQFLHDNINNRTDEFGGSVENRCRFLLNVVKAVCDAIGSDRVGIRLSPWNYFQTTKDSNRLGHWSYLCSELASLPTSQKPAYVHMVEPRVDEELEEDVKIASLTAEQNTIPSLKPFREILQPAGIAFISAGGFGRADTLPKVESGLADIIGFGRWFIANPDLPFRLEEGLPLNDYDRTTFYGAVTPEKGYVDYPVAEAMRDA
ncbi:12-oxophytodienoate reductase 1 [Pseudomassariella vexata]|uniref:12-oxophytodienoate reductase 1 n=1 Tax=Pseudomassariella vexata TaxID=1141098 RepID=A0A1Y2DKM2_9PEZI|nr:12-oxophytodienoate reductase 1 [Pseudomassariella vexata]ORY59676.1 12-oxophytodienoate reductase 1 [Pseudomassariella vexata]